MFSLLLFQETADSCNNTSANAERDADEKDDETNTCAFRGVCGITIGLSSAFIDTSYLVTAWGCRGAVTVAIASSANTKSGGLAGTTRAAGSPSAAFRVEGASHSHGEQQISYKSFKSHLFYYSY